MKLISKIIFYILLILILLLGFTNSNNKIDFWISIILTCYVGLIIFIKLKFKDIDYFSDLVIVPLILLFVISSWVNSSDLRNFIKTEPVNGTYRTDMDDFLKTYYLMSKGINYYESYKIAIENNPFKLKISNNLWSWKPPTIYYIWQLLPIKDFRGIYCLFLTMSAITLYFSFKISQNLLIDKYKKYAILSAYLLYPYLHFASRDQTFLQTEWWGMFVFVIGIYFLVNEKYRWSVIFLLLSCIIRELYIISYSIISIYFIFTNKKIWRYFLIGLFFWLGFLLLHLYFVKLQTIASTSFLQPRIHFWGKQIIIRTLAFGSWEYYFNQIRPFIILYILAITGIIYRWKKVNIGVLSCLLFPFFFVFVGSSIYNDYWGIFYIPFVFISVPIILNIL